MSQQRIASPLVVARCYYASMDIRAIRLNNLRYAVLAAGGVAQLAAIAQVSEKYLKQILSGFKGKRDKNPRRVGDEVANRISAELMKEEGWMDAPHPDLWTALPTMEEHSGLDRSTKPATTARSVSPLGEPWPFRHIAYDRFNRLPEREKGRAEERLLAIIEAWEAGAEKRRTGSAR